MFYSQTIRRGNRSRLLKAPDRVGHSLQAAQRATELLEELVDLYKQYGHEDMRPTPFAYSSAITAWSNSREVDCGERAEDIFWEMWKLPERAGNDVAIAKPNTLVCNSVLRAWSLSQTGSAPDRAEEFFHWMHDQVKIAGNSRVSPDLVSYIYVMRTWVQSRRASSVRRIESHLNAMVDVSKNEESHPLCPNASTYNLLLEAIKISTDNDRAQKCQLLLNQLVNASYNRKEKLWDLTSFHIALKACLPSIRVSKANRLATVEVVRAIFENLKSVSESSSVRLSNQIIETLLRVFLSVSEGGSDRRFLVEVFKFCSTKKGDLDIRLILASLQEHLKEEQYSSLVRLEDEFRGGF